MPRYSNRRYTKWATDPTFEFKSYNIPVHPRPGEKFLKEIAQRVAGFTGESENQVLEHLRKLQPEKVTELASILFDSGLSSEEIIYEIQKLLPPPSAPSTDLLGSKKPEDVERIEPIGPKKFDVGRIESIIPEELPVYPYPKEVERTPASTTTVPEIVPQEVGPQEIEPTPPTPVSQTIPLAGILAGLLLGSLFLMGRAKKGKAGKLSALAPLLGALLGGGGEFSLKNLKGIDITRSGIESLGKILPRLDVDKILEWLTVGGGSK